MCTTRKIDTVGEEAVALNNTLVANGSFESPDVSSEPGGYQYNPSDTTWSFTGDSGLAHNGSDLTLNNPDAADGKQVAFLQDAGIVSQIRTVTAGIYTLTFYATQWEGNTMEQQVRVNLRPSGSGVSIKRFVWCGTRICEERDSTGVVITKRFFAEGEQRIGGSDAGSYYYSRDHLGSIREVTDSGGRLKARYDYDPYGKAVVTDGNMSVDFGYTGHYFHAPSGLNLTLYRAYNPALGRWISRDPIGEAGGLNLYRYVDNTPIIFLDPDGKSAVVWAAAIVTVAVAITIYHVSHLWHPTQESAKEIGNYADGCISIMKDPDNAEKHARAAVDAIDRLGPNLNELGARAGAQAVAGPLEGPLELPIP